MKWLIFKAFFYFWSGLDGENSEVLSLGNAVTEKWKASPRAIQQTGNRAHLSMSVPSIDILFLPTQIGTVERGMCTLKHIWDKTNKHKTSLVTLHQLIFCSLADNMHKVQQPLLWQQDDEPELAYSMANYSFYLANHMTGLSCLMFLFSVFAKLDFF